MSKLGRRRTQVILNLLREANLIRRTSRGYSLNPNAHPTPDTLEALLKTYVDRANRDKERLADMMHYAETLNCRTQIIRAYFSEPEAQPCQRCDNCDREARQAEASEAAEDPILGSETQIPAPPREQVNVIESIHGEIHTTRNLPASTHDEPFHPGDTVRHKRFGPGKVLDLLNDMVLVDFIKQGQKRLRADFLRSA